MNLRPYSNMILILFLLCFSLIANGQNLVDNGSFEREGSSYMKEIQRSDIKLKTYQSSSINLQE
jgi:hypothetical protein